MASANNNATKARLVAAIVEFLKREVQSEGVTEAGAESIEGELIVVAFVLNPLKFLSSFSGYPVPSDGIQHRC